MPQASDELRAKFPGHDAQALDVLAEHFQVGRDFVILPKDPNREPSELESDAIDYLVFEWDYGYDPLGA